MNKFLKLFGVVVLLVLIFIGYRMYLAPVIYVMSGSSMSPTFIIGDKLSVTTDTSVINRGDVVAYSFTTPSGIETELIKRIIGLPGETVEIKTGIIYIDGVETKVEQITSVKSSKTELSDEPTVKLEINQYYVLGDNTAESYDSRFTGAITSDQIIAIVTGKY